MGRSKGSDGRWRVNPAGRVDFRGGTLVREYRDASVIHDYFCDKRRQPRRPWQQVHRVFYEAMRLSGVSVVKAKVMYAAVYRFGPRWNLKISVPCPRFKLCAQSPTITIDYYQPPDDEQSFAALRKTVEADPSVSLEALEQSLDAAFYHDALRDATAQ